MKTILTFHFLLTHSYIQYQCYYICSYYYARKIASSAFHILLFILQLTMKSSFMGDFCTAYPNTWQWNEAINME